MLISVIHSECYDFCNVKLSNILMGYLNLGKILTSLGVLRLRLMYSERQLLTFGYIMDFSFS